MERKMKKWLSVLAATAMVFAMTSTGFARRFDKDHPNLSDLGGTTAPNVGATAGQDILSNTVSFNKVILVEGAGTEAVDEPNVSWKYTIRPAKETGEDKINEGKIPDVTASYKNGTTSISDGTNTVLVYPGTKEQIGAAAGQTTVEKTVEFKSGDTELNGLSISAAQKQQTFKKTVSFTFVEAAFTKPGVYRFVIKEDKTGGANKDEVEDTAGLEADHTNPASPKKEAPYQAERFLDVYVKEVVSGATKSYKIYGYVMHSGDTEKESNKKGNHWTKHKNSGYDGGELKRTGNDTPQGYTKYEPRKLKVRKRISGLVPKDTKFGFEIQLLHGATETTVGNDIKTMQIKAKFTPTPGTYEVMTIEAFHARTHELKDGDAVEVFGLPKGSKVKVREQNKNFVGAVTSDSWVYTAIDFADGNKEPEATGKGHKVLKPVSAGAVNDTYSDFVERTLAKDVGVDYHNHVDEITPTGVVLTVVPYAMMVLVAVSMGFMFLTKRKEE